jgi:hypothetical protein|tara:strand:- start:17 stop:151 length:135 start_codon:yes stop_codon:yes gene_type:complete
VIAFPFEVIVERKSKRDGRIFARDGILGFFFWGLSMPALPEDIR